MGYLLTPTQKEKDTNFINSTLEDLKTTNLLKNAQAGASNASLNAQNTNIPQTTISQTMADNAKNIGFGTNMLNQATNTQATQAKPTQTNNSGIAMSSDKFFNPQAQETTQIPLQTQAKPKTTLLQRERDSINIDKQFDSSVYSRNNVEFLGNPRTFSNHKLAMEAKSRLYDNYADDINENELSELIKRHKILDKAVDALETAKATFGENSKEYKKIFNDYMQYGILKDNNIKDYASLAEFYNNGGNVGFNPKIKTTENATNTNENTTNSNKNNTNFKSIDDFIYQQKKFINDEMRNSDESVFKHIAKRATKIYDTGSQLNSSKQNKQGLNANNAISLMADREMLDNTTKSGLERVNTTQDTSYRDKENATQEQYNEVVADIIDGSYTDKRLTTMSKDWENNKGFLTHAGNALMLPLDLGADTLKGAVNMVSRGMAERYHNKADLVLNEFKLLDKSGASVDVFGSGENGDNLLQMSNYLDKAFSADKKTSSLWENEAKPKLVQYLKAQEKDKDKAWQDYQNAMQKVQEQWDNAPSKLLANSELVELAETMKTQHDYGRFVLNLFKNPNENRELAQSYLNDLHTILKQNDDFKDISEVVLTKSGQVAVKRGDNYETLEQGFLNSILHGIHDSVNEIGLSVGGAIAGGIKGASQAKSLQGKVAGSIVGGVAGGAIGAGLGAITDEQINSWTTGYKNADNGLKRGIEAAGLNIAADIVMIGGGYAIKQGIKGLKNVSDFSVGSSVSGLKDKAMTFANGNVNAVSNFLAKNALEQSEKDLITKEAQAKFLNGRSLQEFRSDTSIPRLERLKTAWQYEKFINKESMDKGKLKLDSLSKEFEKFQTTSMESNRPIMDIFQDMFEAKATRNEREKFLRFVSQNEGLKSALSSVIAKNPTLALNFGKFIDKRASTVAKSIESEALSQGMFKDLDSSYAKALKDRYGKVEFDIIKTLDDINFSDVGIKIHDILTDLKGSIPHVTNAGQTINAMLEKLNARNSMEAVLNDTIEPNLKIDDLLNIRKYYNDILRSKDFKNASYKHLQAINKEIDLAIEKELENLANNSGINTSKLLKNYKEINKEYADYARFKDSDFYKDTIKSKKREKELSNESFNKAILKQAQREEGFNNKVFNRIANNTDKNLQAQAIKELIQKNIANGNGQFRAVKWQELIDDLAKIEHSITDEGLKGLVSNLKQAQKLYHADNEFLQAVQRSIGSKPANVLISAASGFFGRILLLFYNALHKIMSRYAGALSENLAHQSLEHQLSLALRYARDTKDFINVSIDSITKKLPLDDRETSKVLKELEYWKKQFEKDEVSSFYDIKEAQRVEQEIQAHKELLQERKEVLDRQVESIKADLQDLMQEASKESTKGGGNESVFKMERKIDVSMDEREVPKRSKDKLEWYLDEAMQRLDSLLAKKADLEKELEHEKSLDGKWNDIYAHLKSEAITSSKRAINAVKRDIENTKEWINELRADIDSISPKALITIDNALNPNNVSASKDLINIPNNVSTSKALTQVSTNKSLVNKPSMATNLLTYNTKALPNANTTSKDLIPSNVSTSKDLIPLNQKLEKLQELERYLHKLQKLENHFKDFMSMPFSVIVDSKGNAMPLTIEALKGFIFQNLYKEWLNTRKALNMPTLEIDFKPLTNRIKALPYKASSEIKAHLNMVNEKTNSFLDSLQDLKAKAQDLKLLPYNKPKESEASANKVDRFSNVVRENNAIININANEALQKLYSTKGTQMPKELDIKSFMNTLDSIVNKDNFIKHLQKKPDAQNRLAYLNLVEPTLNNWDLKLINGNKTDLIKVFNDGKDFFTLLITQENNKRLITFLPKAREEYIKNKINNADLIQTFISRASKENEWTRTENPTTKPQKMQELETKSIEENTKKQEISNIESKEAKEQAESSMLKEAEGEANKPSNIESKETESTLDKELDKTPLQKEKDFTPKNADKATEINNLKKEFELKDEAFTPTGSIRENTGDFISFGEGQEGVSKGLSEIVENGKLINENGVNTIWYKKDDDIYKVGISKGFHNQGDNNWIVTGYQTSREKDKTFGDALFTDKQPLPNSETDSTTKSPNTENNLDTINIENSTTTKDIHANTEKDTKADTSKDRPSEIENGSNTDDNFIHSHKGDNPQGNNERTESTERDTRASNGNGWQSETMAQKGEENANGEWSIRNNSSQSSNDTKWIDDISHTQQGHNARGRPKNATKNGYKQGGWHDIPKSRDRLHRNVSLKKKDSIALESKEANKAYKDKPQSDKEIDNIQSTSNPAGILNPEETAMLNKEFKLGELEDLKGQKALYDANIKSLELLDDILKSGRVANDEEKQILSNFRGFGKASNELTKIIKEKGQRLEQLNKLLDSLSNQIGKKVDSNYLYRRGDDAYYTPTSIAESMVKLAKDLGLNDKHCILEPSCGSGRFLGQFNASQKVVGIDIDPLTAKIAKTIYPYYKIDNAGFEKSKYAVENAYDLVIGNPPYSNFTIKDDYYKAAAHNYFMKKGIDMLSNGGISIQIVTKNFMDSSNLVTKLDIAKDAKFLGGVRLPNNAFKDASVTTDILVFKKDKALAKHADKSWIETSELNGIPVSKYFLDNPQNVLGEMRVGKGQFGDIVHVINKEEIDFSELDLAKYLTYRDKDIDNITRSDEAIDIDSAINSIKDKKQYDSSVYGRVSFNNKSGEFIKDGEAIDIRQMLNDLEVRWADSTIEKRIEEFKEQAPKINKVQEALYKLQNAEIEDDVDNLANFRRELNEAYDELLGKNGAFHTKNGNIAPKFKLFEMLDDTSFEVFALEKAPILKNGKVVGSERADIFTKRVSYPYVAPQSAENLSNAIAISLNEYGYNSYERIAELLNRDVDSVKKELLDKKLEYLDHNGDRYQKDEFLSGDVKTKLEAFHDEYGLPKFSNDENTAFYQKIAYDDLKAVIPDDIELPLIDIPLGANWLDKNITDSFLRDIIGLQNLTTNYIHGKGFSIHFTHVGDREFLIATGKDFYKQTGMEYISGIKYIEDMLNNKTLLVQKTIQLNGAKEKMTIKDPIATQGLENLKKQLQREFKQYILDDDTFATTAQKQYNDTFNREVRRKYDGSHIQLIGANKDIELREHQKNASYRFFQERSVLLAHDVGTGKSYTMIASALEGKRMKLYNKPIIIAPNHIAPQLAVDARKLYPNANIKLVQAVSRKNKNKELASLKNNKHDLIIGTLTAFTNMNVSPNLFNRYMKQEIKYLKKIESELLNNSNTDAPTRELKSIARRIDNAEKKIKAYIDKVANDKQNVFFEELGIDCLMFDEAHYLKNLPILTAQKNVRGIGNSDSQRAIDAYMKINSLKDNPNSKVLFATGTPITNFISDIYTMQKYMDFDSLERAGIDVFDEWCKQFAGASYEFEMKATGDYKLTSRLRDFRNLPELKNMYYKFADLVTKEDMQKAILENGGKIVEPKINRVNVVLPRNKEQIKFMEEVKKRAKKIEKDPKSAMQKGADNMLKIISDTNKASIDMRLLNPNLKRDENGKIAQCANNILEVYKEFDKHKGTQLVFLDNSVPKKPVKEETLQKWIKELDHTKNILDTKEHEMTSEMAQKLNDKIDNLEGKIAQANCSFSAYDDLKEVLIEKGLKDNEIAFVHDYDGKKELLADKINKGEIRVLIGSTGKMGAGCNFQERLTALHHLDLDWTPANMEQREGRIIRQGNTLMDLVPNFEARIYTYVTEQMSDSLMLQTLEQKTKIIKQIQNPNIMTRKIEDTSEDNLHGRLKAMSSPNAEQELEAMSIVKLIDEISNTISTHDIILKNNKAKMEQASKLESMTKEKIDRLEPFINTTKDNTIISFDKEKIDFEKKPAQNKKAKDSKDKAIDKNPKELANQKLNKLIQDFAKSDNNISIICGYRGLNIIAYKGYKGIDFYLGKDLKDSFPISTTIELREASYGEKDYMQRFDNGYNKLSKDTFKKELQADLQEAKDKRDKALRAFEKESANKDDIAILRNELQDKLVRQAELHYFLGRADDGEKERLMAVYGEDFDGIVKEKFEKGKDVVSKDFKPPIKSQLDKDLSTDEIRQVVDTWDLNSPKKSDKLIVSKVDEKEQELLARDFNFKGNYAVAREIDSEHLAHALNRHGDDSNVANIPITKDEILELYPQITKEYDNRVVTKNNKIIYSRQINGHFVVVEEVLTGRNKLRFNTAWKQKGQLNKEVLFKNAKVFPNAK